MQSFQRAVAQWIGELEEAVREAPHIFPNGIEDLVFIFDNARYQVHATFEEQGLQFVQQNRLAMPPHSPEFNKVGSCSCRFASDNG